MPKPLLTSFGLTFPQYLVVLLLLFASPIAVGTQDEWLDTATNMPARK